MYGAGSVKISSGAGTKQILIYFLSKVKVTCFSHYSILDIVVRFGTICTI